MKTVYVYRGTFDPFHNNHAAICRWCLEQADITSLVIHVNYKETMLANAKNPAPWDVRFNLINTLLDSASRATLENPFSGLSQLNAVVSCKQEFAETIQWIIQQYGHDVQIIQVLGDDVLEMAKDSPHISAYALHQRNNVDSTTSHPFLFDKKRINIPLKLPNISSTHIRSLLITHENCEIESMVPQAVFCALKHIKHYSSLKLSLQQLKRPQIHLTDLFVQQLVARFGEFIYLKYEPEMFSGLSGDRLVSVFSVKKERIAMCKLFTQESYGCSIELDGYEKLARHVNTPQIYFTGDDGFCMEFIVGKNAHSTADFFRIGQAYRQLHTSSIQNIEENKPEKKLLIERKIQKLLKAIPDPDLSIKIEALFVELLKKQEDTSHCLSVIHGDAQPGNTLLTADKVIFIDSSNVTDGSEPSRDVHQMVASIYWRAHNHQCIDSIDETKNNIKAFLSGYEWDLNSPLDVWAFYWHIRTLLLVAGAPETPLSRHIQSKDYPQITEPSIRNHSFWKPMPSPSCSPQDTVTESVLLAPVFY